MDKFLEACGASEALCLEVEGPRPGRVRRWTLPHPFALVGHAPSADLRLRHPQVSLRHAYLQLIEGRLACFDLGSRGGIQWPNGRPARSGWLDPGHPIRIGAFELRRPEQKSASLGAGSGVGSNEAIAPWLLRWEGGGPDAVLEFPDQASGPVLWRLSRVVTLVGRSPGCRVRLPNPNVSWYHCGLVRTPSGIWVVDLMSRVGLSVNGTALRYGQLEDGDELRVGPFRVVLRLVHEGHRTIPRDPRPAAHISLKSREKKRRRPKPARTLVPSDMLPQLIQSALPALQEQPIETELVEMLSTQRGGSMNPALVMVVEQFGRMQQQMLEQFNHSLMLLMQHMGDQYREQMGLVRDEMQRLRELSDELVALKEQVGQAVPEATEPMDRAGTQHPDADKATTPRQESAATMRHAPFAIRNPQAVMHNPQAGAGSPSQAGVSGVSERGHLPGQAPTEDPLVMVSRRIAEIRGEQRSRWQKILDLVRTR